MSFKIFNYKKVNSTNDLAIRKIKQNINKGVILANKQIKGRGQYGRKWISYNGNIFLSIFFNINEKISIKKINKLNCNILKNALSKLIRYKITIKKPNDLLINKKKFVGILQETIIKNQKKYIIIGIGINLIKNPIIENYPTTNILKETKMLMPKKKLITIIVNQFEKNLKKFAIHA